MLLDYDARKKIVHDKAQAFVEMSIKDNRVTGIAEQ